MTTTPSVPEKTILLVDDDDSFRVLVNHILKRAGYSVINAVNGKHALDVLNKAQNLPQLILLDLRMPEMDGWQFRTIQKADPRLSSIPVVIVTTLDTMENDVLSVQAAGYCKKPIESQVLLKTVRDHLK